MKKIEEKGGNCEETMARPSFEKGRHIEPTQTPKLNGEQRPVGFGPRQFARSECWKRVETYLETIALEGSMENIQKLEDIVGKMSTLQHGHCRKTVRNTGEEV